MKFNATSIAGVWVVDLDSHTDSRGFFARTWCADEFGRQGLSTLVAQCSISYNRQRGTLRGMHWQVPPHEEAKLIRCTAGAIFDVCVDLRPHSRTFRQWFGIELSSSNRTALYVPEGCAHGFLTLCDDAEVVYQISTAHQPGAARGFRWDDATIGIAWPAPVMVVSDRDRSYPALGVDG